MANVLAGGVVEVGETRCESVDDGRVRCGSVVVLDDD
mgnify:CR=1 FL=1